MMIALVDPHDNSGRLFGAYKQGNIAVFNRTDGTNLGTFLTLPNVLDDGEAGLIGLVCHPNYESNGKFYVVSDILQCDDEIN
jgi:hypothetical protein